MLNNPISIVKALEAAGIVFIPDEKNGQSGGVGFGTELEPNSIGGLNDGDIVVPV